MIKEPLEKITDIYRKPPDYQRHRGNCLVNSRQGRWNSANEMHLTLHLGNIPCICITPEKLFDKKTDILLMKIKSLILLQMTRVPSCDRPYAALDALFQATHKPHQHPSCTPGRPLKEKQARQKRRLHHREVLMTDKYHVLILKIQARLRA